MNERPKIIFVDQTVDQIETLCLVLPFFADERPLKGFNGLVDWRLNGQLSRQLLAHHVTGTAQETVLIPHPGRIPAQNIVMLGLGPRKEFGSAVFESCLARLHEVLSKARVSDFVFVMNDLIDKIEESRCLAQFVQKNRIAQWVILGPSRSFSASMTAIRSACGEGVECLPGKQWSDSPQRMGVR